MAVREKRAPAIVPSLSRLHRKASGCRRGRAYLCALRLVEGVIRAGEHVRFHPDRLRALDAGRGILVFLGNYLQQRRVSHGVGFHVPAAAIQRGERLELSTARRTRSASRHCGSCNFPPEPENARNLRAFFLAPVTSPRYGLGGPVWIPNGGMHGDI